MLTEIEPSVFVDTNNQTVVRLSTNYWHNDNGFYCSKRLRYLKRKSVGYNIIKEDSGMIGDSGVGERIVNLFDCEDGIYEVVLTDESYDWESGNLGDYSYLLVKYEDKNL